MKKARQMIKKTITSMTYRNSTFWIRTRCIDCRSVAFASYFKVMKLLLIRSHKHAREEFKYLSRPNIPNCMGSEIIENNERMSHITWKVDYYYLLRIVFKRGYLSLLFANWARKKIWHCLGFVLVSKFYLFFTFFCLIPWKRSWWLRKSSLQEQRDLHRPSERI